MRTAEGEAFEQCLLGVNHLLRKGYISVFMTQVDLMRRMMNHFTKLGKMLEVTYLLFWLGWRTGPVPRIQNALRSLNHCRNHPWKPKVLFPVHPQIPHDRLQNRLWTTPKLHPKERYPCHPLSHLWKLLPSGQISQQIQHDKHPQNIPSLKLLPYWWTLHPESVQPGYLQPSLKGTRLHHPRIHEVQNSRNPIEIYREEPDRVVYGEIEDGHDMARRKRRRTPENSLSGGHMIRTNINQPIELLHIEVRQYIYHYKLAYLKIISQTKISLFKNNNAKIYLNLS